MIEHRVEIYTSSLQSFTCLIALEYFVWLWGWIIGVQTKHWSQIIVCLVFFNQEVCPFLLEGLNF